MTETVYIVIAAALGAGAVVAELNLLRVFVRDWRDGGRECQRLPSRAARLPKNRANRRVQRPWQLPRGRLAVLSLVFVAGICASEANARQPGAADAQPVRPESANANATTLSGAAPASSAGQAASADAGSANSPLSLQLNLDFTNAYFYHGILQQDRGLIVQPAAKLTLNLLEEGDLKIDAILGTWNSFGPNNGVQTSDLTQYWYESDLIAGIVVTKGKLSLTVTYTFLTSPSDAYETVQELDFTVAFDDSDALGKFALHPYVLLGVETGGDASDGGGSDPGTYLELGIAPGFSFDVGKTPVAVTFPASVGLSLHDYYQNSAGDDDTFGFAQVGVKTSIPLPFGDRYGKWTLNAGVAALFLGDHTADFNGGDNEQFIGTIGLQINF